MGVRALLIALLAAGAALGGCGKKGAPLAPIVRIPAAVDQIAARRVGADVYVTFTVPVQNIDASTPAAIQRVEVYGFTANTPPPRARFLEGATLVGTVEIEPPPLPGQPPPDPATLRRPVQGAAVTVRDTLTADELIARTLPPLPGVRQAAPPLVAPVAAPAGPLRRFYMAIAFNDRGRPGPWGGAAELPITPLPDPPAELRATYTEDTLTLTWEPSGGVVGFLLDVQRPQEPAPFDQPPAGTPVQPATADLPPGPTTYNVYRDIAPDPLALPGEQPAPPPGTRPLPINPLPLTVFMLADPIAIDERERCYTVRALRGVGEAAVESEPSERRCVTPIDLFAPDPPTGLSAIAGEGAISLIWEPNIEGDLAGYAILRAAAGSATLAPLTPSPISETRYVDRDVVPGTRYTYAVVAVDTRLPVPNVSLESNRVEETAR